MSAHYSQIMPKGRRHLSNRKSGHFYICIRPSGIVSPASHDDHVLSLYRKITSIPLEINLLNRKKHPEKGHKKGCQQTLTPCHFFL
jgi:hypothetical protein